MRAWSSSLGERGFARFALWLLGLAFLLSFGSARDARADCVLNGTVVLCSGASPLGFTAATNGLTVNVQTGATVGTGIVVLDNNTVSNMGTVSVGSGTTAIAAGNNNTITSSGTIIAIDAGMGISITGTGSTTNSGTITVGDGGTGLSAATATNTGTINAGDSGFGIVGTVDAGRLTNSGSISVSDTGTGIFSSANSLMISNTGTISYGGCGTGIDAQGIGNTISNSGTIREVTCGGGGGGIGILAGSTATVTNTGTITVGETGYGIVGGTNAVITNSGTIRTGDEGGGIIVEDDSRATNSGTIIVGTGSSFLTGGMVGYGDRIRLTNTGTITGGQGAPAMIITGVDGVLINNGTIVVGDEGGGMIAQDRNASITNTGSITGGVEATGINAQERDAVIVNSGTISVGSCGRGIDTSGTTGATITNSGRITGTGCDATGVMMGTNDTLNNSGTITGPVAIRSEGTATVTNSGTLDGRIRLEGPSSTLTNSGTITVSAPWTGTGVQHTIDGTFTQTAAGMLGLRVSPTATAFDSLSVTGAFARGGTLKAMVQPGLYAATTTYASALTYGSATGTFSSLQTSTPFFTLSAVYGATRTDLVLTRVPFNQAIPASGANGQAVGNVLEQNYSTNLTGNAAAAYSALLASTAPTTLSQLTGEVSTAGPSAAFAGFNQFFSTVFSQTSSVRNGGQALGGRNGLQTASLRDITSGGGTRMMMSDACDLDSCGGPASFHRVTAWAQGFGGAGSMDRNAQIGSSRLDVTTAGGATGIDVQFTPNLTAGFTMGTATSGYALTDLASSGTAQMALFGLYGGYTAGPAYVDAALAFGYGGFNSTRYVNTGSLNERIDGAYSGSLYGGRLEGGWNVTVDERHKLTPFANLTVQAFRQSGYAETSQTLGTGAPGLLAVIVHPQTTTSVRSVIGGQIETVFQLDAAVSVAPRLRLGWAHEFNTQRSTTVALNFLPNAPFTVTGSSPPADSLIVTAGIDIDVGKMVRVYAQFDGDFASTARSYAGTGGVRLFW